MFGRGDNPDKHTKALITAIEYGYNYMIENAYVSLDPMELTQTIHKFRCATNPDYNHAIKEQKDRVKLQQNVKTNKTDISILSENSDIPNESIRTNTK